MTQSNPHSLYRHTQTQKSDTVKMDENPIPLREQLTTFKKPLIYNNLLCPLNTSSNPKLKLPPHIHTTTHTTEPMNH